MKKTITLVSVAFATIMSISGCGGSSSSTTSKTSNPEKELIFDMAGDYDLSSYMVLERDKAIQYKETIKKNNNGANDYSSVEGNTTYPTIDYSRDGQQDARAKKSLNGRSIILEDVDYELLNTKIIKTVLSPDRDVIEFARHIDLNDVVAKSTKSYDGNKTRYIFCKLSDEKDKLEIEGKMYEHILVISCNIENNSSATIDGTTIDKSSKGTTTQYYAKNQALIKSIVQTCTSKKIDGQKFSNICTQKTMDRLPF